MCQGSCAKPILSILSSPVTISLVATHCVDTGKVVFGKSVATPCPKCFLCSAVPSPSFNPIPAMSRSCTLFVFHQHKYITLSVLFHHPPCHHHHVPYRHQVWYVRFLFEQLWVMFFPDLVLVSHKRQPSLPQSWPAQGLDLTS